MSTSITKETIRETRLESTAGCGIVKHRASCTGESITVAITANEPNDSTPPVMKKLTLTETEARLLRALLEGAFGS